MDLTEALQTLLSSGMSAEDIAEYIRQHKSVDTWREEGFRSLDSHNNRDYTLDDLAFLLADYTVKNNKSEKNSYDYEDVTDLTKCLVDLIKDLNDIYWASKKFHKITLPNFKEFFEF